MGVCGCGKSTIGVQLAQKLGLPFYDGDDFHPAANIEKMKSGTPLNDQDRKPWLERIVRELHEPENGVIIACSALKLSYREILRSRGPITIIHLHGTKEVLTQRLNHRAQESDHFMPSQLLTSQLETLQDPSGEIHTITINIDQSIDSIVNSLHKELTHSSISSFT